MSSLFQSYEKVPVCLLLRRTACPPRQLMQLQPATLKLDHKDDPPSRFGDVPAAFSSASSETSLVKISSSL
jgi:hypothetical protein